MDHFGKVLPRLEMQSEMGRVHVELVRLLQRAVVLLY